MYVCLSVYCKSEINMFKQKEIICSSLLQEVSILDGFYCPVKQTRSYKSYLPFKEIGKKDVDVFIKLKS